MQLKNYLTEILLFTIIILIIGGYSLYIYNYYFKDEVAVDNTIIEKVEVETEVNEKNKYTIEIKGEVNSPGVYVMDSDSRINDAIILAGGFTNNSYTDNINLSKKISDELVINIYTKYEHYLLGQEKVKIVYKEAECKCPSYDITSCTDDGASVIEIGDNIEEAENKLININTASIEELTTLSGIGEAKAKAIIDYRNTNGNFETTEDIMNVSGVSDATYEKFKDSITV